MKKADFVIRTPLICLGWDVHLLRRTHQRLSGRGVFESWTSSAFTGLGLGVPAKLDRVPGYRQNPVTETCVLH